MPHNFKELLELILDEFKMKKPLLNYSPKWLEKSFQVPVLKQLVEFTFEYLDIPTQLVPYICQDTEYDCSNTEDILKNTDIDLPILENYLPVIISYYLENLIFT